MLLLDPCHPPGNVVYFSVSLCVNIFNSVDCFPSEVILTLGNSRTVMEFLCAAKEKKRSFRVFVAEGAPRFV